MRKNTSAIFWIFKVLKAVKMQVMQLLIVVLIAFSVFVSPEPIEEGWPRHVQNFPPVRVIDSVRNIAFEYAPETLGHRVPRNAKEWPMQIQISPPVRIMDSHRNLPIEYAPEILGHRVLRRADPIGEVWPKTFHISPTVRRIELIKNVEGLRVPRSAEPIGEEWQRQSDISSPVKIMDSTGSEAIEYDNKTLGHRVPRRVGICAIPKSMEDSQLECKIYPSTVLCYQTCMFGYTLTEGIQRKMKCKLDEDRWTPVNRFENCKPFVDCTLTLGPGGKFKCHFNFLEKGTHCDVSCQHFEDKPAVPTTTYVCDINGDWSPELPFCARPGTGMKLTSAPSGPKTAAEL